MFDIINLVFAAGVVISQVQLYSSEDYKAPPQREGIVSVSMHREFYREDGQGKCEFKGVMVPFVRDWDDIRPMGDGQEMVLKADPETTAGMVFLVNQKVCEGKETEILFRAGDKYRLTEGNNFFKKHSLMATDMLATSKDQQPKWLIQALDRVERLAPTNPTAAQFLETSKNEIAFVRGIADGTVVPGKEADNEHKAGQ